MSQFDADALERAAKAARELENSRNVKAYLEISKREHQHRMEGEKTKQKEFEAQKAAQVKDTERVKWEEQRKTIRMNSEEQMRVEQYRAEQKRKAVMDEHKLQRERNQELVQMQTQEEMKRESMRRATEQEIQEERRRTDEHRAQLERENLRARAVAEAEGRIKEQRENEDVIARQIGLKGEQERLRVKESITTFFDSLGTSLTHFLQDRKLLGTSLVAATALAGGFFAVRESARVAARVVERRLGKPQLVRETSRLAGHYGVQKRLKRVLGVVKEEDFSDVILRDEVDSRVMESAEATRNTRKHGAPYRHMLFYGPPGTGKTMVAKRLARSSGMDYAIMSGGDVGPLGHDAVSELHKLFDWAETSRRGLLLFIDEADAFLASRSRSNMSESQRNALNAVLYRTGETSRRFMLVLATNRPGDLDAALSDRVDEAFLFDLPTQKEREKLVLQYFDTYVRRADETARQGESLIRGLLLGRSARIQVSSDVTDDVLRGVAEKLEGFSGRSIAKLMIAVQATVYGRRAPLLDKVLLHEVVDRALEDHEKRQRVLPGVEYS